MRKRENSSFNDLIRSLTVVPPLSSFLAFLVWGKNKEGKNLNLCTKNVRLTSQVKMKLK